jgi:diguanylate cyclase (GGDEF)-like protein
MNLDLITLSWVMLLTSLTLAFSVIVVDWGTSEHDGLSVWGFGLLAHAASYPLFTLRLSGQATLSMLGTTLANSCAIALLTVAVSRFQAGRGPTLRMALVWTPPPIAVLVALVTLDSNHWRTVSNTFILGTQAALFGWVAWAPWLTGVRERGRVLLTAGAGILIFMLVARTIQALLGSNWNAPMPVGVPEVLQARTYYITLGVLLLITMGYVLMQKERAMSVLHELAVRDPLTGVSNRRVVMDQLSHALALAARQNQPLSLLMFDIDWFKQVNDTHGHQAGDLVLISVVAAVGQRLRTTDVLGRIGGEEFVAVLPNTSAGGARALAEDLRRTVAATPIVVDGQAIHTTVSVGVYTTAADAPALDFDEIVAQCDSALYAAKRNGRNRVEYVERLAS